MYTELQPTKTLSQVGTPQRNQNVTTWKNTKPQSQLAISLQQRANNFPGLRTE